MPKGKTYKKPSRAALAALCDAIEAKDPVATAKHLAGIDPDLVCNPYERAGLGCLRRLLGFAALQQNNVECVRVLLDAGATVDLAYRQGGAKSSRGWTALHEAACADDVETVKLLLARGASTTIVSSNGKTALDVASPKAKKVLARI